MAPEKNGYSPETKLAPENWLSCQKQNWRRGKLATRQKETSEDSGTWKNAFSPETKPVPPQLVTPRGRNLYLKKRLLARNKLAR